MPNESDTTQSSAKPKPLDQVRAVICAKPYGPRTEEAIVNLIRSKKPRKLPVVAAKEEVSSVLGHLSGIHWIMANLLHGVGLRLTECPRLRVKDIDFSYGRIVVRDGKGGKDRVTMLPDKVKEPLRNHLEQVERLHEDDPREGFGDVYPPHAQAVKYPNAGRSGWRYVFPASQRSVDPGTGAVRGHHPREQVPRSSLKDAVRRAGVVKTASCHSLRHLFATHLLQDGYDIRTVQELPGHEDVNTTMIYTHVLNKGGNGVRSPADLLRDELPPVGEMGPGPAAPFSAWSETSPLSDPPALSIPFT